MNFSYFPMNSSGNFHFFSNIIEEKLYISLQCFHCAVWTSANVCKQCKLCNSKKIQCQKSPTSEFGYTKKRKMVICFVNIWEFQVWMKRNSKVGANCQSFICHSEVWVHQNRNEWDIGELFHFNAYVRSVLKTNAS